MHTHAHTQVHTYVHAPAHTRTHLCTCTYTQGHETHMTLTWMLLHTYLHTHRNTYSQAMHTCVHMVGRAGSLGTWSPSLGRRPKPQASSGPRAQASALPAPVRVHTARRAPPGLSSPCQCSGMPGPGASQFYPRVLHLGVTSGAEPPAGTKLGEAPRWSHHPLGRSDGPPGLQTCPGRPGTERDGLPQEWRPGLLGWKGCRPPTAAGPGPGPQCLSGLSWAALPWAWPRRLPGQVWSPRIGGASRQPVKPALHGTPRSRPTRGGQGSFVTV